MFQIYKKIQTKTSGYHVDIVFCAAKSIVKLTQLFPGSNLTSVLKFRQILKLFSPVVILNAA